MRLLLPIALWIHRTTRDLKTTRRPENAWGWRPEWAARRLLWDEPNVASSDCRQPTRHLVVRSEPRASSDRTLAIDAQPVVSMSIGTLAAAAGAAGHRAVAVADDLHCGPAVVARRVAQQLSLSRRETEVLLAVAAGKCIKETAADLGVGEKAVQYFWGRIFAKSGCASQVQVLALLLRHATSAPVR